MEILAVVVVVAVVIFLIAKGKSKTITGKTHSKSSANAGAANEIPSGYQIWVARPEVAGLMHRKKDAVEFVRSKHKRLILEREPDNTHDANAIKLIGVGDGRQFFIGYVPKEISEQIAATERFDCVQARLRKTYVSEKNFVDIEYQIIGPKAQKKAFDAYHSSKAATEIQKDYLKFFGIPFSKDITSGVADNQIAEHRKTVTEEELKEWEAYQNILNEFNDPDFRESYDLKKVSKAVLLSVLKVMHESGNSYSYLDSNIDEVVEKIIETKPDLEKAS